MSEKEENDLFYICSLIEHVGRKTKNLRGDVEGGNAPLFI